MASEGLFEDQPQHPLCSYNVCTNGHIWPPTLLSTPCPGCQTAIVAIKKENCPFCNEPIIRTNLRVDTVPRGAGVVKRCEKQEVPGESMDVLLERTGWKEIEGNWKNFKEKKVDEDRQRQIENE